MNTYVTGSTIRQLRETKHLTQAELAAKLSVSAKTPSGRRPKACPTFPCWNLWRPRWASRYWN